MLTLTFPIGIFQLLFLGTKEMNPSNYQMMIAIASAIFGGIISYAIIKVAAKSALLVYRVTTERVAITNQDIIFGAIQVTWQGRPVDNLFYSVVEIENASTHDISNIRFKIYTPAEVLILSANPIILDSTYVLRLTDQYSQIIHIEQGAQPTPLQTETYFHEKEYICDVFNRGQKIQIQVLSNCKTRTFPPDIFLDTQHQGVRLKWQKSQMNIHGVPVYIAIRWGITTSILILLLIAFNVSSPWITSSLSMLVGLFAQSIGAFLYRVFRKVWDIITK